MEKNKLTPRKITRLMNLAEGITPYYSNYLGVEMRRDLTDKYTGVKTADQEVENSTSQDSKSNTNEYSSGILDLDRCAGFGESGMGDTGNSFSLNKSTNFNTAEMTGRSTGTSEMIRNEQYTSHLETSNFPTKLTNTIDELTARLQKQSFDVADVMRQSIASGLSFHANLTKDEETFIRQSDNIPVHPSDLIMNITRNMDLKESDNSNVPNISVGSYFNKHSVTMEKMFPRSHSPCYDASSMDSNLQEGDSRHFGQQPGFTTINTTGSCITMDSSLDHVPVRQPRVSSIPKSPLNQTPSDIRLTSSMIGPSTLNAPKLKHMLPTIEDESSITDASISVSFIAKYLCGTDSEVTPSMLISELKNAKGQNSEKNLPLSELNTNVGFDKNSKRNEEDANLYVKTLKENGKSETASTAASMKTNISNKENIALTGPFVYVTDYSEDCNVIDNESHKRARSPVSKSSNSPSTCSTIKENVLSMTTVRSGISPSHNKGDAKNSNLPSPTSRYKELDNSVNWQEILQQKGATEIDKAEEVWADVAAPTVEGFVSVNTTTTITLLSLSDSWLTATIQFENVSADLVIDLPRFPILLSPNAKEKITLTITAYNEMKCDLPFLVVLRDSSIDTDIKQKHKLEINFIIPDIQLVTEEGSVNSINFPPAHENEEYVKPFVIMSNCTDDLQITLSVADKARSFSLSNVHVIKRDDVEHCFTVHTKNDKKVLKRSDKVTCILPKGNAIKATLTFKQLNLRAKLSSFSGVLRTQLVGTEIILQETDIKAIVGITQIIFDIDKLNMGSDTHDLVIRNTGTIKGTWKVKITKVPNNGQHSFHVIPDNVEIDSNGQSTLKLICKGLSDDIVNGILVMEDMGSGKKTKLEITAGYQRKLFPIKTTHCELPWIRKGKKDINLKNITERKVTVKCRIHGDGFVMETSRANGKDMLLTFAPNECRPMSINFEPLSDKPYKASLTISPEGDPTNIKSVRLHGCDCGATPRWSGPIICGDVALVSASYREPVQLVLYNRSKSPAFLVTSVRFSVQYSSVAATAQLTPERTVMPGRSTTQIVLNMDWARVERLVHELGDVTAATLATVTVLTGAEMTRRRILRIMKNEDCTRVIPDSISSYLNRLAGPFDGEDLESDANLEEFNESKKSLEVLTAGLRELCAQIEVPRDFADEHTVIADLTTLNHHTLCD